MNPMAMRKTNLMITPNKIRDRVDNRVQWRNRTSAYLKEIVGRVALGTSWMQTKALQGYQYHSVVLRQIGILALE